MKYVYLYYYFSSGKSNIKGFTCKRNVYISIFCFLHIIYSF
jgi:hypothetical protein